MDAAMSSFKIDVSKLSAKTKSASEKEVVTELVTGTACPVKRCPATYGGRCPAFPEKTIPWRGRCDCFCVIVHSTQVLPKKEESFTDRSPIEFHAHCASQFA